MSAEHEIPDRPLKLRRRRATAAFWLRVTVLTAIISGVTYAGWFSRIAKTERTRPVPVEFVR